MASPSKHWVFTLNNPPLSDPEYQAIFQRLPCSYICFQREVGQQGTPHLQGYLEANKRIRITGLKKFQGLQTAHFEKRRGTREEARDYCLKSDTRHPDSEFWESTDFPNQAQGKRTDLDAVAALIKTGANSRTVSDSFPAAYIKYTRGINALISLQASWREDPPEVILLYGPPGTGKTRQVYSSSAVDSLYTMPLQFKAHWFDGYDGQPDVLWDDFDGRLSSVPLAFILRLIDRYSIRVPVKGGFTLFAPKRIFITSNYHPRDWYDFLERRAQWSALARRFTQVYDFTTSPPTVISRPDPDPRLWSLSPWERFWT